jgi:hypothetical protein
MFSHAFYVVGFLRTIEISNITMKGLTKQAATLKSENKRLENQLFHTGIFLTVALFRRQMIVLTIFLRSR